MHRASMQAYKDELVSKQHTVHYIEYNREPGNSFLAIALKKYDISRITLVEVVDHGLKKRIVEEMDSLQIEIEWLATPSFLTPEAWYAHFFKGTKHYSQSRFYKAQRQRLNILIDDKGKPVGGKWSYDPENRKKIPSSKQTNHSPSKNHNTLQ